VIVDIQSVGILLVLIKATLLLGAGLAVTGLLRRSSAVTRHAVWLVTVTGVLALPVWMGLAPMRLEVLPGWPSGASSGAPRLEEVVAPRHSPVIAIEERSASPALPPGVGQPVVSAPGWFRPTAGQGLLLIWTAVALVLLGRLVAGLLAVRRIVGAASPLDGPAWKGILCDAADRLGRAELPRLVASERVDVPFACGLRRGTIVMPASAEDWSDERRRLVLFHELAHLRRRDLLGHMLGRLACALYWFHPLAWTAARRLRTESERACDDLVLACGTRPSEYAGHLLEILTSARRPGALAAAVAMARRTEFEGRVLAILDPLAPRGVPGRFRSAALMGSLAFLFLCVAALAPAPPPGTPAENPSRESPRSKVAENPKQPTQPAQAKRQSTAAPNPRPQARSRAERDDEVETETESEEVEVPLTAEQTALLVRVLRTDAEASVRRSAAWSLAPATDGAAVEGLTAALKADSDDGVREMAAWALADARAGETTTALGAALQEDRSDEVRAIAAWALGQRPRASQDALVAGAADRSAGVRETAIWALGNQDLEKAPAVLLTALRDAEAHVRVVAAWALGQIADPATAPAVRAALKEEKVEEVRQALFHALVFLGERSPEVIAELLESKDPDVRARAVQMLSRGGGHWPWPWPRPDPRPVP
jgi:beta-lactamase regulating signal transducer with metallopeptidase domain/HEAT repeat protein